MVFFLLFFLAVGFAAAVLPPVALGLTVGLLGGSLRMPVRIALLLACAATLSLGWVVLLHDSYLLPVVLVLVVAATAGSGAAGMGWAAHRRRTRAVRGAAAGHTVGSWGQFGYWDQPRTFTPPTADQTVPFPN